MSTTYKSHRARRQEKLAVKMEVVREQRQKEKNNKRLKASARELGYQQVYYAQNKDRLLSQRKDRYEFLKQHDQEKWRHLYIVPNIQKYRSLSKEERQTLAKAPNRRARRHLYYLQNRERMIAQAKERITYIRLYEPEKHARILEQKARYRYHLLPEEERWERWRAYFAYARERAASQALQQYWIQKLDHLYMARAIGKKAA